LMAVLFQCIVIRRVNARFLAHSSETDVSLAFQQS
jgi:hypothetical protein